MSTSKRKEKKKRKRVARERYKRLVKLEIEGEKRNSKDRILILGLLNMVILLWCRWGGIIIIKLPTRRKNDRLNTKKKEF